MMERLIRHYRVLCLVLLLHVHFNVYFSLSSSTFPSYSPNSTHLCPFEQSLALLQFKNSLLVSSEPDSYCDGSQPKTMSWTDDADCCSWHGVTCDNLTGNVIGLDLACSWLNGAIDQNSSLFHLSNLQRLNLAYNNFEYYQIPHEFGRFRELTYLNLSHSHFFGPVPSEISQLSKLHVLDLSSLCPITSDLFPVGLGNIITINQQNFDLLAQNLTRLSVLNLECVHMSSVRAYSLSNLSFPVTFLDLGATNIQGIIPDEVFRLPNLEELYLFANKDLTGYLPESNWSSPLRILKLSGSNFAGQIPDSIGNLKFLEVIAIGNCKFRGSLPPLIGNLSQITELRFSYNNFSGQVPSSLSKLEQLIHFDLRGNRFEGHFPDIFCNLGRLTFLDVSKNNFSGQMPPSIFNLIQLDTLTFSSNFLSGPLPHHVSGLLNLSSLDLSDNLLNGKVPSWLFTLPSLQTIRLENNQLAGPIDEFKAPNSLKELYLKNNSIYGSIPSSIFELVNLTSLDLSSNNLSGTLQFELLSKLENLQGLDLSYNSLLSVSSNSSVSYTLPQLFHLGLSSCNINKFPSFLRTLTNLKRLDISKNRIHGRILISESKGWKNLVYLNLSHNFVTFIEQHPWKNIDTLDLRNNTLEGSLLVPPPKTQVFLVSNNKLTGHIPSSICNLTSLLYLDLSYNNLSGKIPPCLGSTMLVMLHLQQNNLHGGLPDTFANGCSLESLNFNSNNLEGLLPPSLANCRGLEVINLGNNKISDTFPYWFGTLSELKILVLRSNRFYGPMSDYSASFPFSKLRILDISYNEFIGFLRGSPFENLKAMMNVSSDESKVRYIGDSYYQDSVIVKMKGQDMVIQKIITLFTAIDLSNNQFQGEIPEVLGNLKSLIVLNLGHNSLKGKIPSSLGNLTALESLDLSSNKLDGRIPVQLQSLTFLSALNLSHNQLSGPIPQGGQFSTFLSNSFIGNIGLCGEQISVKCGKDGVLPSPVSQEEDDNTNGFDWKIPLMGYGSGLVIGFSTGYIVFSTGKPRCVGRMFERERRRN